MHECTTTRGSTLRENVVSVAADVQEDRVGAPADYTYRRLWVVWMWSTRRARSVDRRV